MIAGIILAAGRGTRIKSTTNNKVTIPFLNKPMILYGVEFLSQVASPVVVVVGAFADSVREVLKNYDVIFAQQTDQLGTAHAVAAGLEELDGIADGGSLVLVGYGDHMMFYTIDTANDLISYHKTHQAAIALVTTKVPDPTGYGRIIRNASGHVEAIVEEKDAAADQKQIREINAGLYCFNYSFLKDNINKIEKSPVTGEYYLTDLVAIANNQGKKVAGLEVEFKNVGIGINRPEELAESQKIYLQTKSNSS